MFLSSTYVRHPLLHGPISNTTRSVPIAYYCLSYNYALHGKRSKGSSLVNKSKPVH